jgi:short-subunit dehydrogenase
VRAGRARSKAAAVVSLVTPGVVDTAYFERRKVPYQRQHPQLISAQRAADAIIEAVDRGLDDIVVPRGCRFRPA